MVLMPPTLSTDCVIYYKNIQKFDLWSVDFLTGTTIPVQSAHLHECWGMNVYEWDRRLEYLDVPEIFQDFKDFCYVKYPWQWFDFLRFARDNWNITQYI